MNLMRLIENFFYMKLYLLNSIYEENITDNY